MTTLHFTLKIAGLPEDSFVVREYQGHDSLSDHRFDNNLSCYGFRYVIELASRKPNHIPLGIVDNKAQLSIYENGVITKKINGIIKNFTQGDTGHNHTYYSLTLVPALERLSLRHNSRIFQFKTVPEIITTLLSEMGISDYRFSLQRELKQREFCVQYRESDIAFLHRLAAEEGIIYTFDHLDDRHIIHFVDDNRSLEKLTSPIVFNSTSGPSSDNSYIRSFNKHTECKNTDSVLSDYSFKKPQYRLIQEARGTNIHEQKENYEYFDFPGRFKNDEVGKAFNRTRLEYLRRNAHIAQAESNCTHLSAGQKFTLNEHLNDSMNIEWLVVHATHSGTQPQALEEDGGNGTTTYSNQFTVIPSNIRWQAEPQPKPKVDGPSIATVVGPEGEEIYCDEYGRVKLHFPWDRYSNGDENSSCWVRVSQNWAGNQYGMMALPRVGHEVVVSFLHSDPDQPIVTGRTYHSTNTPPYSLPENKTKTIFRSETHKGNGFNELSFEDHSKKEQIYLHAQKNFVAEVLNDQTLCVHNDKHLTIDNNHFTHIKHNHHSTIDGEYRKKVAGDETRIIGNSHHQKSGDLYVLQAGNEVHLKGGAKIVIEAGAEITFKVGGNFVKVDPSGVSIVGPMINLNSGGSAGTGSGFKGAQAELPNKVEGAEPPPDTQPFSISRQLLQKAESEHVPAVKTCSKPQGKR